MVAVSPIQCVSESEHIQASVVQLLSLTNFHSLNYKEMVARVNRAPPFVTGLGTSDTYLFKRTLLI